MKSWKKRWQEELNNVTPALSDEVKNAPITTVATAEPPKKTFRKTMAFTLAGLFAGIPAAVGCFVYFNSIFNQKANAEVFLVEVNPQAVFSVDKKGKVTAVAANNVDADIVLSTERVKEMKGKPVEDAVKIFVDYTARLGYLDLSQEGAVRITSSAEGKRLEAVDEALEEYFREKGAYIAVLEESVTAEAFCYRAGFDGTVSEGELSSFVEALPIFYYSREAETLDVTALQALYRENVPMDEAKCFFEAALKENIEEIEKNIADVEAIATLSDTIMLHKDNPCKLLLIGADYWTLLQLENKEYTEEFTALMTEMQGLLTAYQTAYGTDISSLTDLEKATEACYRLPLEELKTFLLEFSTDILTENFEILAQLLENVGVDLSEWKAFYKPPENVNEYLGKMQSYVNSRYQRLEEEYAEAYGRVREKLTQTDYDVYLQNLTKKYGSLSAYWEQIKNN